MNDKYTHKKGIVYLNQYHIVFCPKYRRKVLVGDIEKDLRQIFYDIAKEKEVEIRALEIMPDHVHMFISFDPRQPLHELIRYFKGTSSRILREKYPKLRSRIPSLWTRSYFLLYCWIRKRRSNAKVYRKSEECIERCGQLWN